MRASVAASVVASIVVRPFRLGFVLLRVFSQNKQAHTYTRASMGPRWNGGGACGGARNRKMKGGREECLLKFCLFLFFFYAVGE